MLARVCRGCDSGPWGIGNEAIGYSITESLGFFREQAGDEMVRSKI